MKRFLFWPGLLACLVGCGYGEVGGETHQHQERQAAGSSDDPQRFVDPWRPFRPEEPQPQPFRLGCYVTLENGLNLIPAAVPPEFGCSDAMSIACGDVPAEGHIPWYCVRGEDGWTTCSFEYPDCPRERCAIGQPEDETMPPVVADRGRGACYAHRSWDLVGGSGS